MSDNDIHGIKDGWSVKTADGESVGTVEETTERYILVKSGLINASRHYLPAATLAHVRPEKSEIGISLTQAAFDEGDWTEPPAHGPRTEGAPLNAGSDEEVEEMMETGTVEPERPSEEYVPRG
jgi:hypothetical protein